MCRLSQITGKDSSIHVRSGVSSFVQTFFPAMFAVLLSTHALNYTSFPGLVQAAAESECGVSLHGHRKCSQAGCLLVNCDLGESILEGGYTLESTSPRNREGLAWCLLSHVTPPLLRYTWEDRPFVKKAWVAAKRHHFAGSPRSHTANWLVTGYATKDGMLESPPLVLISCPVITISLDHICMSHTLRWYWTTYV